LLINRLLPDFLAAHPRFQLELVGEDRPIDIVAEGYDAGIRLGDFVEADMVSVRLTTAERFVVVGTPSVFKAQGRPVRPEDLHGFPLHPSSDRCEWCGPLAICRSETACNHRGHGSPGDQRC